MSIHFRKKVILTAINAKYIHSNLAVYSLYAYAEKMNVEADLAIAEYTINQDVGKVMEELYRQKPDLIAFSCYIWNIAYVKRLVGMLKQVLPETEIWLGGPEVTYSAETILQELPIDGVMLGEGEVVFLEVVSAFALGEPELYRKIPGVAGKGFINPAGTPPPLDSLPFPYAAFPIDQFENRIVYYETMRGCPFHCSYCLSSVDRGVRFRNMDLVREELQFFLDRKVKQVKFVDRTFNCMDIRAFEIWQYLLEHDNGITNFHFEIAAQTMSDAALSLIEKMRPGLLRLEIGVQTTNEGTMELIRRKMEWEQLVHVTERLLHAGNVHLHLDLIAGLPKENYVSFQKSFSDVYRLRPHELQLGFLKVLNGTQMEKDAFTYGIRYQPEPPYEVLVTDALAYEEIRALKAVAEMVEIYHNSRQFERTMEYLVRMVKSPFTLYDMLAKFYAEKGYDLLQPSRIMRYEILLEFFAEKLKKPSFLSARMSRMLTECLTYDLYVREKVKRRPAFAGEEVMIKHLPEFSGNRQLQYDTHAEAFEELLGEYRVLLFDYRKRDPVTGNVEVTDITAMFGGTTHDKTNR